MKKLYCVNVIAGNFEVPPLPEAETDAIRVAGDNTIPDKSRCVAAALRPHQAHKRNTHTTILDVGGYPALQI